MLRMMGDDSIMLIQVQDQLVTSGYNDWVNLCRHVIEQGVKLESASDHNYYEILKVSKEPETPKWVRMTDRIAKLTRRYRG